MYRIAEALGIDSHKYDRLNKTDNLETENNYNLTGYENESPIIKIDDPYKIICSNCSHERKINELFSKPSTNIAKLISCDNCKKKEIYHNNII